MESYISHANYNRGKIILIRTKLHWNNESNDDNEEEIVNLFILTS